MNFKRNLNLINFTALFFVIIALIFLANSLYRNYDITSSGLPSNEDKITVGKFYNHLIKSEVKITSQNREDGVILALIDFLKLSEPGYYVEFGTENGNEINTRHIRTKLKWTGKST